MIRGQSTNFCPCSEQLFPDDEEMRLGVGLKLWCRLNSWRLDFGKRLSIFVWLGCAMMVGWMS